MSSTVGESREAKGLERLILFSDAVIAIAITLLALELPVPSGATAGELRDSVGDDFGDYLAFVISFVVIATAWFQHQAVMQAASRSDSRLRLLNTAWLFTIVLVPFATKLLTNEGDETLGAHAMRFGFYALVQVAAAGLLLAIVRHVAPGGAARAELRGVEVRSYGLMLGFGASIPLFLVTKQGWIAWIVGPLVVAQVMGSRRRR